MFKEIEKEILAHLNWLGSGFKFLAVKFIGFVVTCWLVIGALWIGLVIPVSLMKPNLLHGNEARIIVSRDAMRRQINDYRMNPAPNRISYRVLPVEQKRTNEPVIKSGIRSAANTVNELRRFNQGVESLVR